MDQCKLSIGLYELSASENASIKFPSSTTLSHSVNGIEYIMGLAETRFRY